MFPLTLGEKAEVVATCDHLKSLRFSPSLPNAFTDHGAVMLAAEESRRCGMTFGAADNDLQYLSDTACCCSGVDQFPGFENCFRHRVAYAVRKSRGNGGRITYGLISREWAQHGSIDRFLNSRSRLSSRAADEGTLSQHLKARSNDSGSTISPAQFHGVVSTDEQTRDWLTWARTSTPMGNEYLRDSDDGRRARAAHFKADREALG